MYTIHEALARERVHSLRSEASDAHEQRVSRATRRAAHAVRKMHRAERRADRLATRAVCALLDAPSSVYWSD